MTFYIQVANFILQSTFDYSGKKYWHFIFLCYLCAKLKKEPVPVYKLLGDYGNG